MAALSRERLIELSKALHSKGRLHWGAGSRITDGYRQGGRVIEGDTTYAAWYGEGPTADGGGHQEQCPVSPELFLDLNDGATVGVLADYARELWSCDGLYLTPECADGEERMVWALCCDGFEFSAQRYGTRAEAWAEAILSAPARSGG